MALINWSSKYSVGVEALDNQHNAPINVLNEHREKHQELSAKVAEFVSRHKEGDATICIPLLRFMRDWLTNHMQTEDREYVPWLRAHSVR